MKKVDKKRKPRKKLSTAVSLIVILMFSAVFIYFGICMGFLINAFLNYSINDIILNAFLTLLVGTVYVILLLILIRNKDIENVKPFKWYINGILLSFTLTLIITAITVLTAENEKNSIINYVIGFAMFPLIGIITTFNIVKYVKKDTARWKDIFYNKGNLHKIQKSKDYYRVNTPVSFEKKIISTIYKQKFLNILVILGIMAITITGCIKHIMRGDSTVSNLIELKAKRSFGFILFLSILFLAFIIPLIAFYVSSARKKIRVVRNHEYIAYHAIVSGVRNGNISIYDKNKHYSYKYCTCVGIKEKNVHLTPATLIFIPDDVLLFPDNEDYKVDKDKKKK